MIVAVEVSGEDIVFGEREDCEKCPAARALLRHVAPGVRVKVGDSTEDGITFSIGDDWKRVPLPPAVMEFVADFDDERFVEPFTFSLDIPERFLPGGTG